MGVHVQKFLKRQRLSQVELEGSRRRGEFSPRWSLLGIGSNSPAKQSLAQTNSGSPGRAARANPFCPSESGIQLGEVYLSGRIRVARTSTFRSDKTPSYRQPERPLYSDRSNPCRPIDSIGRPCFCPSESARGVQNFCTGISIFGSSGGILGNFLAPYKSQKLGLYV